MFGGVFWAKILYAVRRHVVQQSRVMLARRARLHQVRIVAQERFEFVGIAAYDGVDGRFEIRSRCLEKVLECLPVGIPMDDRDELLRIRQRATRPLRLCQSISIQSASSRDSASAHARMLPESHAVCRSTARLVYCSRLGLVLRRSASDTSLVIA